MHRAVVYEAHLTEEYREESENFTRLKYCEWSNGEAHTAEKEAQRLTNHMVASLVHEFDTE